MAAQKDPDPHAVRPRVKDLKAGRLWLDRRAQRHQTRKTAPPNPPTPGPTPPHPTLQPPAMLLMLRLSRRGCSAVRGGEREVKGGLRAAPSVRRIKAVPLFRCLQVRRH